MKNENEMEKSHSLPAPIAASVWRLRGSSARLGFASFSGHVTRKKATPLLEAS